MRAQRPAAKMFQKRTIPRTNEEHLPQLKTSAMEDEYGTRLRSLSFALWIGWYQKAIITPRHDTPNIFNKFISIIL